jgi:hypothetical protein
VTSESVATQCMHQLLLWKPHNLPLLLPAGQGNVVRIEAWWEGGGARPAALPAAEATPASQPQQQSRHSAVQEAGAPPMVNFLPHTQMPAFREPRETILVAVRVTFARGLVQVGATPGLHARWAMAPAEAWKAAGDPMDCAADLEHARAGRAAGDATASLHLTQVVGNETAAHAASSRASYSFAGGEAVRRLTIWSGQASLDGRTMAPLVGGFSFTTSLKGAFIAGEPPRTPLPPTTPAAADDSSGGTGAAASRPPFDRGARNRTSAAAGEGTRQLSRGGSGATAAATDQQGATSGSSGGGSNAAVGGGGAGGRPPPLDPALVGGSNATLSGEELGTGLLVGASGFTSGSALNALGFLFVKGGRDATEL